jgi:hypothetical protein
VPPCDGDVGPRSLTRCSADPRRPPKVEGTATTAGRHATEMAKARTFPFVPKSALSLRPGDFWSVPLSDGSFAAGRVIELCPRGRPGGRSMFLGALMGWWGPSEPAFADLNGAPVLEQAMMHVVAITRSGGSVLGNRSLELDGIAPWEFFEAGEVYTGVTWRRRASDADRALPHRSTWGFNVIRIKAEKAYRDRL